MTHVQPTSSGPPARSPQDEAALNVMLWDLVARVKAVRRWLVLLAVLKAVAIGLVCGAVYVAGYAALDHYVALGAIPRVLCLVVLVAGLTYLLVHLLRALAAHISCRNAANHVERAFDLQQQLVTVVEYAETREAYAYSEALAGRLVERVHSLSGNRDFRETIPRKRACLFILVMVVGLAFLGFYARDNYRFFSRYLARLVQPLGSQEPLGALQLETLTGDIVAEPNSAVLLAAAIAGRLPNEGALIIEPTDKEQATENEAARTLELAPTYSNDDEPRFTVEVVLAAGRYRYRFESGRAATEWHAIAMAHVPTIENIVAEVQPPTGATALESYTEPVEAHTIEVYRKSRVNLSVEASQALSEASVTGLDGQTVSPQSADQGFQYSFEATREGFLKFQLTNADGLANSSIPDLQILLKEDEPPALELKSPSGDYLATNVASIPIEFEITDDFGVAEAELVVEIGAMEPITVPAHVKAGTQRTHVDYTLDLDSYDLAVGDSILYYATASDTSTGLNAQPSTTTSELYLIEIKPYRQRWHAASWNLPGQSPQGLDGEELHASILSILEWTRAIVKKTFAIAAKDNVDEQDEARLDAINTDLTYVMEQLSLVRDDPRYRFGPDEIATIDAILDEFRAAGSALRDHDAPAALVHEKKGYQGLRKFLLILDRTLGLPGGGMIQTGPDAVKVDEKVHATRFEAERIEWELKRLANRLEELADQQIELSRRFERFLERPGPKKRHDQATTDEEAWTDANDRPPDDEGRPRPGQPGDGAPLDESLLTVEGALPVPGPMQGGAAQANSASREQRMNMLRAQQQALRQTAESLKTELAQLPFPSDDRDDRDGRIAAQRERARELIGEAIDEMDEFERALAKAYFDPGEEEALAAEAKEALDNANLLLADARDALADQIGYSEEEQRAREYEEMARRLERLADEYAAASDPAALDELLEEMAKAQAMLPDVPVSQNTVFANGDEFFGSPLYGTALAQPGTPGAPAAVPGGAIWSDATPADSAHFLAREFWTRAVEAKKQQSELSDPDVSDVAFHRFEKRFFENAARYGQ